jgi:hypothetical protein
VRWPVIVVGHDHERWFGRKRDAYHPVDRGLSEADVDHDRNSNDNSKRWKCDPNVVLDRSFDVHWIRSLDGKSSEPRIILDRFNR